MSPENKEFQEGEDRNKQDERRKINGAFDATKLPSEFLVAKGVGESWIQADASVDNGKFDKTSAILSTMGDSEISKLETTVPVENRAEFLKEATVAKTEFMEASQRIMVNPELTAEEKRKEIEGLSRIFIGRIEEAQGKINGKYAKASEKSKTDTEAETKDADKKNRDFREAFEKSFKEAAEKVQRDQAERAAQKRIEIARLNQTTEAATKPPLDFAEKAVGSVR